MGRYEKKKWTAKPKPTEQSLRWEIIATVRECGLDSERAEKKMIPILERWHNLRLNRKPETAGAKSGKRAKRVARPIELAEVGHQYQNEDSLERM